MVTPLSYTLFEIAGLIWIISCVYFRIKKGDMKKYLVVLELLSITAFGMTLEILAVESGKYLYPPFNFMIFDVPLIIGIGWSTILFSIMWMTDSLKIPEWSRIFVDGFFALLIDLNMDAVAIRDIYTFDSLTSGMWVWNIPFNAEWFGVPWSNFAVWWLIIVSMSTALRGLRFLSKKIEKTIFSILYPIIAYGVAVLLLVLTGNLSQLINNMILFIIQMSFSCILIIWKFRTLEKPISIKKDFPVYFVSIGFHTFFLVLMIVKGYYIGVNQILWTSIIVLVIHLSFLTFISIQSKKKFKNSSILN